MVLALSDVGSTLALVGIFFVLFPIIAQGLIMFAAAVSLGERAENEEYKCRHRMPGDA